jgi:hypothetical protein
MLQPLYNVAVDGMVNKVTNALTALTETDGPLEGRAVSGPLDLFVSDVQNMPTADIVDIVENLDFDKIMTDGKFNSDALATLFKDSGNAQNLQDAFAASFDPSLTGITPTVEAPLPNVAHFNSAMDSFADLADMMKNMMDGDFEISSFLALYNNLTRGMKALDDTFDGAVIGSTMNTVMDVIHVFTILGEKGLVVYESLNQIQTEIDQVT